MMGNVKTKGKSYRGELNEEKVYFIGYVSEASNREMAEKYGVAVSTINNIRKNLTCRHVTKDYKFELAA